MKVTFVKNNTVLTYDNTFVYLDNVRYAYYSTSLVRRYSPEKTIGRITRINGDTYGNLIIPGSSQIRTNIHDHTLRSVPSDNIVATYEGTPSGAIACFLVYEFLESQKTNIRSNVINKEQSHFVDSKKQIIEETKTTTSKPNLQGNVITPKKVFKPEPIQPITPIKEKVIIPKKVVKPEESVYKPEQPKYEDAHKTQYTPPNIPISSASNSGESSAGCIVAFIVVAVIYFAIKLIPQSWRDLSTYIPEGDVGITICFFSSVIGAILAVLVAIFKKEYVFRSSMSTFLAVCGISCIINSIIQISDVVEGTYEFLGSPIIDIPLSIFASLLGQFQFALPIGIGLLIVCGIIYAVKKK